MLKTLRLDNVILVERATVDFSSGLNVLTGETGAGKSAILAALALVLGQRASSNIIRRDAKKATIEALFDIDNLPEVCRRLESAGIEHEPGEELVIRRDIMATGKSRAFINNQAAHLTLLKSLGGELLDIVGQHANRRLLGTDEHRRLVDFFGELNKTVEAFKDSYEKEHKTHIELSTLKTNEGKRLRQLEVCKREVEELELAELKMGEEEELFNEYSRLANADELGQKVSGVISLLSGHSGLVGALNRQTGNLDEICQVDNDLEADTQAFKSAVLELQEVAYNLTQYRANIDANPAKLQQVNERLGLINSIKRKYGGNVEAAIKYLEETKNRLDELKGADLRIEELERAVEEAAQATNSAAKKLTAEREKSAKRLGKQLTTKLRLLNMPQVEVDIRLTAQKRNRQGDESIEFFIAPNPGELPVPVKDCASGGELARLMLAVKALLAGKESLTTLVFDEIDANIGGETANVVADTLHEIGNGHQLICITHFPQVARRADRHVRIKKASVDGRTLTSVAILEGNARQEELTRMLGGDQFSKATRALAEQVLSVEA